MGMKFPNKNDNNGMNFGERDFAYKDSLVEFEANVKDFNIIGDGVTDNTEKIQDIANEYNRIYFPNGHYIISDTLLFALEGCEIIGESEEDTIIECTNATKFAINLFTKATSITKFSISTMHIIAKYGIHARFENTYDLFNANPTTGLEIKNVNLTGMYDASSDPSAGGDVYVGTDVLESNGIGIFLPLCYRPIVQSCQLQGYGVGLESKGCTLGRFLNNRFIKNGINIHDERIDWYNSAFGMGADNLIESCDILDSTYASVSFINTFGTNLRHCYLENVIRSGVTSSPIMLYMGDCEKTTIEDSHFNTYLSSIQGTPFIDIVATNSQSHANKIIKNRATPRLDTLTSSIRILQTYQKSSYPNLLLYKDNDSFPLLKNIYAVSDSEANKSIFTFNNLSEHHKIGGILSASTSPLFTQTNSYWHIQEGSDNITFELTMENPNLTNTALLEFSVEPTVAGGSDGRLYVGITQDGTTIFNDYAFRGVDAKTIITLPVTLNSADALVTLKLDLTSLSFARINSVKLIRNDEPKNLTGTTLERPTIGNNINDSYFDQTLGYVIHWNGTAWVDSTGTTV